MAPVAPASYGATLIYNPVANQWMPAGELQHGCNMWEATWVKLADGSILALDSQATTTERYVGSSWVSDSNVPVMLYSGTYPNGNEEGPSLLLPMATPSSLERRILLQSISQDPEVPLRVHGLRDHR